ncbi:MAG TPA: glycosyltransferase, partial [Magnetospirillaceae bacterium]|nr:glycosyltransferase [Magnetospirillaceae bacterium]
GSVSALVELTYRLGFYGIANTQGLLDMYKHRFGGRGVLLKSVVDMQKWHPRDDRDYTPQKPYKVFFYARPNMPRNAFELGIAGLLKLKEQLGADVQIMTAGANWDDEALGVRGQIINLQQIPYDEVPAYYRTIDAGLMFMFSGHPGVTASELMASGCPVVVNEYDDSTWHELYQDGKTCLVTLPTASEIARNLRRCLEDQALRKTLIEGGLAKAKTFYKGYEASQKTAFKAIQKG